MFKYCQKSAGAAGLAKALQNYLISGNSANKSSKDFLLGRGCHSSGQAFRQTGHGTVHSADVR